MADKTKEAVEETVADEAVPEMNPTGDTLNLTDIAAVIQIIDVVTKRGAFEGNEMADVGSIRNRLEKFIKAAAPKDTAPTKAAPKTEEK
jgi:hypothetical protein